MKSRQEVEKSYKEIFKQLQNEPDSTVPVIRRLAKHDRYFLLVHILGRKDMQNDWLFARCREVERSSHKVLDLWAREHYKSSIKTYAGIIQRILQNPEITIGIFSHTKKEARSFLSQIKRELENNEFLYQLFPDILWQKREQAPSWSVQDGITVKRHSNPKEATIEASGLVDGQPIGKHYKILSYDDVVTKESVTSPEMILKTTNAWELSLNLGSRDGEIWYAGTRYHFNDTYKTMIDRGAVVPRIYPATDNGKMDGNPEFLTREQLEEKRRDMGPFTFGAQMLLDPRADEVQGFSEEWLRFYEPSLFSTANLNLYLLCDNANEKKKDSDYTVMVILGLGPDENIYLVDGIRDRLNLTERADWYIHFYRKYKPVAAGYEKYGLMADIEHIEYKQTKINYRFDILKLGGQMPKLDRIRRMVPVFEQGRFYLPSYLYFIDHERKQRDFTNEFINDEYLPFPASSFFDILDCTSRILDEDLDAVFPDEFVEEVQDTADNNFELFAG